MLTLLPQSLCSHFLRVNVHCENIGAWYSVLYMEKSQTSLDIRNPGLMALPPGVERYFVRGGGLSVLDVLPEDKLEIINDEGKQTCEIVVFNSKGKSDPSILNLKENSDAGFSKKNNFKWWKNYKII